MSIKPNKTIKATFSSEQKWLLLSYAKSIGIEFTNFSLLQQAFTHSSLFYSKAEIIQKSNQRLEFLGDSILALIVCHNLYIENPSIDEGSLSKQKAYLVSEVVLSQIATSLGLIQYLCSSNGEDYTSKKSVLADTLEALVGAIYLDKGLEYTIKIVLRWYEPYLQEIKINGLLDNNYKTLLNEFSQKKYKVEPIYKVVQENGLDSAKLYIVKVVVNNKIEAFGEGGNKKTAEQEAAKNLYKKIMDNN